MNNATANGSDLTEYRRRLIARLLIRKPNITRRELHASLATPDEMGNPRFINKKTGKPYSLGTIQADIDWLKADWRNRAGQDYDDWVAGELAKLDELEAAAWQEKEYIVVLRCMERRAKLKGLDAPTRQEISGEGGGPIETKNVSISKLSDDELNTLAEIARRVGGDREGTGQA